MELEEFLHGWLTRIEGKVDKVIADSVPREEQDRRERRLEDRLMSLERKVDEALTGLGGRVTAVETQLKALEELPGRMAELERNDNIGEGERRHKLWMFPAVATVIGLAIDATMVFLFGSHLK